MVKPLYTFLITTYECNGKGVEYTLENVKMIIEQTYRPIQVVVSDHSRNDDIEVALRGLDWKGVDFTYDRYRENYGNPCHNWNNALRFAKGDYIHYFAMDDCLADEDSVDDVIRLMTKHPEKRWFIMPCFDYTTGKIFTPRWNEGILTHNTLSGPSSSVIRRDLSGVCLDPQFSWFLDLDWYYRLYLASGPPYITTIRGWINRVHENSLSQTVNVTAEKQQLELEKLYRKYGNPLPRAKT